VRLNCLLVAVWLWIRGRAHGWLCVRRSVSLAGLIPHLAHIEQHGLDWVLTEYIPTRRKGCGAQQPDTALLFRGRYRRRVLREVASSEADTLQDAINQIDLMEPTA